MKKSKLATPLATFKTVLCPERLITASTSRCDTLKDDEARPGGMVDIVEVGQSLSTQTTTPGGFWGKEFEGSGA